MADYISQKDISLASHAFDEASKSPCLMKHGCVAPMNGKIIGRGHNHYRTNSHDKIIHRMCSCHAEIDTIRNTYYAMRAHVKSRSHQLKVV